ncbi:alpha-glucosidase/alpha-galactosidase [Fimbriimonas ginsengisoli]|uniref:Glycoside hydrolase family 4 n=1 Tax=Fimbriimonas ginsengisoli Gsoil 348 TaxID=661478 RepID=A0A068NWQ1_FIMGI|nr:alpha-glucosidase/alpha-galactosidase [Fimbriimonas ginsengisoli]AIE87797.1 glycoside hydrolase family 4 [Fimbriimonas ginsengisoli Gsoil 348]
MSIKVAVIGAGSVGFTRGICRDILTVPELQDTKFAFHDINEHNLDMTTQLMRRDIEANGVPATVTPTLDRKAALDGADYVLCFVRVGGLEAFATDVDIPLKYGVDQCVGDTLGPGGIMYAQRGIPVLLDFCRDIKTHAASDCTFLNYSNPMAMLTWACNKYGGVKTIGLCHGVQGGHWQIARAIESWAREKGMIAEDEKVTKKDVDIVCAGINHQTWYVQIRWRGMDMVPHLLEAFESVEHFRQTEKVRIDMLRRFGYYSTESNGHLSEYVPWYRKRPSEIMEWIDLGSWINGETGGYLRVCTEGRRWFEHDFPNWMSGEPNSFTPDKRGEEHGSYIIESLETGRVYRGHFNVVNNGVIANLPNDCIIEAPGYVDRNGVNMPLVGDLPLGCAAVCNVSVSVQRLAVEAAVHGDDTLLKQAMMMDPLTGAVCNPPEIWQMADEMLIAGEAWLPQYSDAISAAKERLATGPLVLTRDYAGAARLPTKTIEEMETKAQEQRKLAGESDKAKER